MEKEPQQLSATDERRLDKALSLAHWSYVGIIVPIIGWILAGSANSTLRLIPRTERNKAELWSIKVHIIFSTILSFIVVFIWIAVLLNRPTPQCGLVNVGNNVVMLPPCSQ